MTKLEFNWDSRVFEPETDNNTYKEEYKKDKFVCYACGSDRFRVFVTVIIDDARLYCVDCGREFGEDNIKLKEID